ncbi:arginine N-succinyltransferase [Rosenbergiella epipactidis]|uniref:arginine N-succinyltransferase n=1 Tax=Rosenbergiella epipactidis TaxID=1544694 RepID=UPI001F50365C|nr:arginine N-succinyltransferase [Rosenbergiella epipactidis]
MVIFRPVVPEDLQDILALSARVGVGMTSLPHDEARLASKIARSIDTFNQTLPRSDQGFLFVLEDTETQKVFGVSAIEVAVGLSEPFYNFRLQRTVKASKELGIYKNLDVLSLSYDHTGHSELCTLFLDPDYQKHRYGQLLSKARFLFMASFRDAFSHSLFAELRGVVDEQGQSPFWDALGKHFFDIPFADADRLTGIGKKTFIAELMPSYPIYTLLLPEAAQAVIGKVHPNTAPARAILEKEGFRWRGSVDIFDAGPVIEANMDDVRIIKESQLCSVEQLPTFYAQSHLICNTHFSQFRAVLAEGELTQHHLDALLLDDEHPARIAPLSPREAAV